MISYFAFSQDALLQKKEARLRFHTNAHETTIEELQNH